MDQSQIKMRKQKLEATLEEPELPQPGKGALLRFLYNHHHAFGLEEGERGETNHPFQVLGIDVMDLPVTERANRHVVVIRDLFTKWPRVFPVPDQKPSRFTTLIAEVIAVFGVPEALLSDRGTNLLSHLVMDLCAISWVS